MLRFHSLKVTEIAPDAEDAIAIALEVPLGLRAEYTGRPGQHVVLRMQLQDEEVRRTYARGNAPGEWPLRIVPRVHGAGAVSRYLAEQVKLGDQLDVLPPNGSFTPREGADGAGTCVAFAAGCGITPVLSVLRSFLAGGNGSFILFYRHRATARA